MINLDPEKAVCPVCGGKMEPGYLKAFSGNPLRWFNEKPGFLASIYSIGKSLTRPKKWYQFQSDISEVKAVRCEKCRIGFFSYDDDK